MGEELSPALTTEQTEILVYAERRGELGVFAIDKGERIDLSLASDAPRQWRAVVARAQAVYAEALQELVRLQYMSLVEDARPRGGRELKYVITPTGRARVSGS